MSNPDTTVDALLAIVAGLMRGERYSRRSVAQLSGKSLPTADRWIKSIVTHLPGAFIERRGKTSVLSYLAATPLIRSTRSA